MSIGDTAILEVQFTGYWHAGTGKAGYGLDALTHRDAQDCPAMPMSQVKGALRETALKLWEPAETKRFFGGEGNAQRNESPLEFRGELRLQEATLRAFEANAAARRQLFRTIAATRIDENGVADEGSLRMIEVVVPLTLIGIVALRGGGLSADWRQRLDALCAATLAFGKMKTDGYGRALASCQEATP